LEDNWSDVRGKIKRRWDKITDEDVRTLGDNVDQLVGRIQKRTGESRETIERFLAHAVAGTASAFQRAGQAWESTASQVKKGMEQSYESFKEGIVEAGDVVRARPGQTVGLAFGIGILLGVGLALLFRRWR
jgi:ElaB/YqjD/DUF883 family membrane-anchored ribosome-binding protein